MSDCERDEKAPIKVEKYSPAPHMLAGGRGEGKATPARPFTVLDLSRLSGHDYGGSDNM